MFNKCRFLAILLVAIAFMSGGISAQQPGSGSQKTTPPPAVAPVKPPEPRSSPAPAQPAAGPTPVAPTPVQPAVGPTPVAPTPAQPAAGPTPVAPTPVQPVVGPTPVAPTPAQPAVGPTPVAPTPVQPVVGPTPVAPTPAQPAVGPTPVAPTPAAPTYDPFAHPANPSQSGSGSSGYPDDGTDQSAPPTDITPQNPVVKVFENGKVQVKVGSDRHFGYRLGDEIAVTIQVLTDANIMVNFEAIKKGILAPDGSDFEVVDSHISSKSNKDQKLWQLDLTLRSFVPQMIKKGIVFNADFLYAKDMLHDGKTPNWKRLTTPDFLVTTSNTADNGTDLLEGNGDQVADRSSWFTFPMLLAGLVLTLYGPALLVVEWYRRKHPPKVVPPNELAWNTFDRVFDDGKANGFTPRHYRLIASALRKYLEVEQATMAEALEQLKDHPQRDAISSALGKCDSVLYANQTLTEAQNFELWMELLKVVPRP